MSRSFDGPVMRRHYIDRSRSGARPRGEGARHRANTCGPAATLWECNDVHTPCAGAGHYAICMKQAVRPMYECRDDRAIFAELAEAWRQRLRRQDQGAVAARPQEGRRRRLRGLPGDGRRPFRPAEGRGGLRRPDSRSRHPQVHDAVGQDRDLLHGDGRRADRYGLGAMPPIPTWFNPVKARDEGQMGGDCMAAYEAGGGAAAAAERAGSSRSGAFVPVVLTLLTRVL
jgi:hypothetical protein